MTAEENKAIEKLSREILDYCEGEDSSIYVIGLLEKTRKLIKKLQKENEEYKLLNANIEKANKIIEGKEEYIPKDKIRELFKKYNINISEEEITVDGLDALTFIEEIDELLEEE